jgi:hypothetical protein
MQQVNIPYCYLIGWSKEGKYYYGVKYGRDATPATFWKKYFTSSKYVKQMREKFGEPTIIEVRRTFKTSEEAIKWEEKVIRRMNIVKSECWLNRNNTSTGTKGIVNVPKTQAQREHQRFQILGKKHSLETKDKISKSLKKYKRTKEHQEKINKAIQGKKVPTLMTGEYSACLICNSAIYNTRWCINRGYVRKTCSSECKSVNKLRLKQIRGY